MRAPFIPLASLAILVASGCSETVFVEAPAVEPVIEPLPVSVAVYYPDALRNHSCTGDNGYIAFSWTFALGPPSVELFDHLFEAMFENVETVDAGPENGRDGGGKDLIELQLAMFNGCEARWPIVGTTVVEIAYKAIVWSAEGTEIAQWEGRGRAGPGDDLGQYAAVSEVSYLAALTRVAMRRAAADFIVTFETEPSIRASLAR